MKSKFLIISMLALVACTQNMSDKKLSLLSIPVAHKDSVEDNYFGTLIADPYRWLENDTAPEVADWVVQQNKATFHYLEQIPIRNEIKTRLTEIWNYEKFSTPFKEGDYWYFGKNNGLQNQYVIYRTKNLQEASKAEVFLDPNQFSEDGTVSLASLSFSKDHKFAAVGLAKSGSDWNELFVLDVTTLKKTTDKIEWVKFSGATWFNNGFYYSRYDAPAKGKDFSNRNEFMKIYYHQLGSDQSKDVLVYEDKKHPLRYFNANITEDERFTFINISEGTSGNEVLIRENFPAQKITVQNRPNDFKLLCKGFANNFSVVGNDGDQILVVTDLNAPKYKLVAIDIKNTDQKFWKTIIPEGKDLLEGVVTAGGDLIASYLVDASTRLRHYDLKGNLKKEIELPGIGTASTSGCKANESVIAYTYVSFTEPGKIKFYDLKNQQQQEWGAKPNYKFDPTQFETKQVFYTSKDGTKVPMFIMHKKGIKLDGNNPTLLYGYGGFNINLTPSFSVSRVMFLERGGVYAIANLRGGGEYGEEWHQAGMLNKKQNVFDDFIAAAEYLIAEKYTNKNKLAINGGSNGGLLVGACMTQRPELFKVAIPAVGVLDMLRYHKFTIGWGWAVEYGSSDNKEQFEYILKYSPLHNVKDSVSYPATLIMTADHDDRVVPAHSFKFAATLQEKPVSVDKPILIRIDTKAGHGAGKPTTKLIEDATDMYAFVLWNLR
jgi:prolyl oligopeptidase